MKWNDIFYDELDQLLEDTEKPDILPNPVPIYKSQYSRKPDAVRVSFSDGSTAVYDIRIEQPAPVILENIRIIRKIKVGYEYQQPRRRRARK